MRHWWLSDSVRLRLLISLSGCLSIIAIQPGWAEEKIGSGEKIRPTITSQIPQLKEIELPVTSAQILVQTPTPNNSPSAQEDVVIITGVKANPTDKGIEVILETKQGDKLQVVNRSVSNNFVADIIGGQLRLTSGETFTFRSEKPLAGITQITVINVDENTVRVTVVGEKVLPSVELFDDNLGLIFAVASTEKATQNSTPNPPSQAERREETQQDEPIELVVTGEQDGYLVPNASTATRTDVPLRDIPQSIQVVPQQVLEDRKIRGVTEAVETVSGVIDGGDGTSRIIRGFSQGGVFRNGYRDINQFGLTSPIETVNQVEVLKGPASVLYGAVEPGGIINITSKKPLSEPYYKLALDVGNYGFYKPSIDLSGPLNADKTALYRFIASYQNSSDFQGFANIEQTTLAPSITLNLGTRTKLDIYYEYAKLFEDPLRRPTALFSDNSLLPRNLYLAYPDFSFADKTIHRYGYEFKHEFSNNWQIRNSFSGVDCRYICH